LSLVIKIHPHVKGDERDRQEQFVERMQRQYERVYESRASISFLTANALFTVTLNGGTLMDNFYTGSPVLSLARGFFHETEAVVYDTPTPPRAWRACWIGGSCPGRSVACAGSGRWLAGTTACASRRRVRRAKTSL